MNSKRMFVLSCVLILFVTGVAKIWSAFGQARILQLSDPVFGVRFWHLLFGVGLLEIAASLFCLFSLREFAGLISIAWLSSCFLVYRTALHWVGWGHHCPCIGNLTDALHIPPQMVDTAMKITLAYLLIGSYATLFWLWRQSKKAEVRMQNDEVKSLSANSD